MNSRLPKMLNCAHEKIPGRCISGAKLPEDAMALSLMDRGRSQAGRTADTTRSPKYLRVSPQFGIGGSTIFFKEITL